MNGKDPNIHLLLPMSGQGSRFRRAGYDLPKPLIDVGGTPMIARLLRNFPERWSAVFVLATEHQSTRLPALLQELRPKSKLVFIDHQEPSESGLTGPARAVWAGLKEIDPAVAVLVSYCDYGMVWDAERFAQFVATSGCDAAVTSYRGFHPHYLGPQMYAYARVEQGLIKEVREKACFSDNREMEHASAGGYYFRSAALLGEALQFQSKNIPKINNEDYVSLTVQSLLKLRPEADARVFEIPGFFQWGTPDDLSNFCYWERTCAAYNRFLPARAGLFVEQLLMPMAGKGERFRAFSKLPKPLHKVQGQCMFVGALESLPRAGKTVFVALAEHRPEIERAASTQLHHGQWVWLDKTPSGQALSTKAALAALDSQKPVLVSACDHEIVVDPVLWRRFTANPDCSAAIFTIKGYPGTRRRPEAFAYVDAEEAGDFPLVRAVSVKKPLSATPGNDHLLVGSFWFRSAAILEQGIAALERAGVRVQGELYLDSIFELLMRLGHKVRLFTLSGYLNRGDPDALAESLYYQEQFCGEALAPRARWPKAWGE